MTLSLSQIKDQPNHTWQISEFPTPRVNSIEFAESYEDLVCRHAGGAEIGGDTMCKEVELYWLENHRNSPFKVEPPNKSIPRAATMHARSYRSRVAEHYQRISMI